MGNQSSKGKEGFESFPSFTRSDTQGSTRSFSSLRRKIKGGGGNGDQSETNSIHGSLRSERSEKSLRDGATGAEEDGTPEPQPPPTPPHASPIKNKGSHTPPRGESVSSPRTSGDHPHSPNSHPNAALDTLMPHNIEPILIKSPPSDTATSPAEVGGEPPKAPAFSHDGIGLGGSIGAMSPFSSLTMNALTPAGLDDIIQRLLTTAYNAKITKNFCLRTHEIISLCQAARELFMSQPTLIELTPPVKIVGDVHGQFGDLIRMFEMCGWPPKANYLFLGDYVDRGRQSLETVCLLFALKVRWPENFFLLRGNHECANVTRVYGFYDECKRRTSIKIWKTFIDVFNCLPIASIVAGKIFCVHGGLSPSLKHMDDIRRIIRPTDVPDYGLLNDLLWSDPGDTQADWEDNERGVSYTFGRNVINEFLHKHDFDLVCRAHMVVEDGYEFFNERTLVTVFSAPNYCGEFDNWGAVMSVNEELLCSFELLKPLDASGVKAALRQSRKNGALGVAQSPPAVLSTQSVP